MKSFKHICIGILLALTAWQAHGAAVVYPGDGNIDFREGSLELWVTPYFEPERAVEKADFPATFFTLDLPGEARKNQLYLMAWRQPRENRPQYNALRLSLWLDGQGFGGPEIPAALLRRGEPCRIGMTWQNGDLKLYHNRKLVWQGKFSLPDGKVNPDDCFILIGGRSIMRPESAPERERMLPEFQSAVGVSAIRIGATARDLTAEEPDGPLRDTLLYDRPAKADREKKLTSPQVISSRKKFGTLTGAWRLTEQEIRLNIKDRE